VKISCQSCQAKYTIADEKVLGKIVKIRCKKCGATIVINGNEQDATQAYDTGAAQQQPPQAGAAFDYSAQQGGEPWTVNVSDGDQRSMTTAELVEAYRGAVVNDETYCWKDGMADWLPLREIPELSAACAGGGGAQPAAMGGYEPQAAPPPADDQPTQAGFSSLFGMGGAPQPQNGGAALFGGGAAAAAAPATTAARRAGGRGGGGADLFGSVAQAGSEQEAAMAASAAAPPPADDKLTGARNENSVLFSLAALTTAAPEKKNDTPMAQGEGSGLIDIRALSASMESKGDGGGRKVDDIMNLSGGGAFSAALAAPVLAPAPADMGDFSATGEKRKGNTSLMLGILGGFAVLGVLIAGGLFFALRGGSSSSVASTAASNTTATPTATSTDTTGTAQPDPSGAVAAAGTTTAERPGVGVAAGGGHEHPGAVHEQHVTTGGGGHEAALPTPPPQTGGGGGKCAPGDLQCAMAQGAGGGGGGTHEAASGGGGGTAPFDRSAAAGALGGIAASAQSCKSGSGPTGSGHAKITFQPSGHVSSVEIDGGPFPGTSVGGCVAGKFRGAHIPAFSGGAVTVGKSFTIN
jgi:predicted Zn finger-like uncharacterized protein